MNAARGIAGASADACPVTVLDRRIIDDLFHDLPCAFRRKFCLSGNDRETPGIVRERLRRHERIFRHVGADIVGGTLPAVPIQCAPGTCRDAFPATVAEMRRDKRIRFDFRIGQKKDITLAGAEFIGQD